MLSQGGEFAFVVLTQALALALIDADFANRVSLVVGVSMALTSPLVMLFGIMQRKLGKATPAYDEHWDDDQPGVIIAGFGRFGQIIGRLMYANKIRITILESDASKIHILRKFGYKVFYGDSTHLELLRAAGAE